MKVKSWMNFQKIHSLNFNYVACCSASNLETRMSQDPTHCPFLLVIIKRFVCCHRPQIDSEIAIKKKLKMCIQLSRHLKTYFGDQFSSDNPQFDPIWIWEHTHLLPSALAYVNELNGKVKQKSPISISNVCECRKVIFQFTWVILMSNRRGFFRVHYSIVPNKTS